MIALRPLAMLVAALLLQACAVGERGETSAPPSAPPPATPPAAAEAKPVTLAQARAVSTPWSITVASWNILNFGNRKAGIAPNPAHPNLLQAMANIISQYDIVVLQEVLNGGGGVTMGLAPLLPAYTCVNISQPAGRAGRRENYAVCYVNAPELTYAGAYDYLGNNYGAINGTVQTAQNIWMRPPARVAFRYKKPDDSFFEFDITTIHTKPQYSAGARPAGTPVHAPKFASVRNELTSTDDNLQSVNANRIVIGDLNADCVYYQPRFRANEFNGWNWVIGDGEKTNTAQSSSCAYDRILLNNAIQPVYQAHGIFRTGINLRVDGRRVSDHYLVWVRFGGTSKKKVAQVVTVSAAQPVAKKRRITRSMTVALKGKNLAATQTGQTAAVYITPYLKTRNFDSFNAYPLSDVRGAPSRVAITSSGDFATPVTWATSATGLFNTVVDMNGDGVFRASDGDVANNGNEADVIVVPGGDTHSLLASLDDNGNLRELFDADRAENVYAVARDLPAVHDVDLYVVAKQLLPSSFTGWPAMKSLGTLQLASVAVPTTATTGSLILPPLGANDTGQQQPGDPLSYFTTLTTDPEGGLFASAWSKPGLLYNGAVYRGQPSSFDAPDGLGLPEIEPGDKRDLCDPEIVAAFPQIAPACRAPTPGSGKRAAAGTGISTGSSFAAHYGSRFNIVLDVNRNGRFDAPDLVDTYDIGDMTGFFAAGNTSLSAANDGAAAVGEYKAFLNAHLNLNAELVPGNVYSAATKLAALAYNCSQTLTVGFFDQHLKPDAEVGFRLQNNEVYISEVDAADRYSYATNAHWDGVEANFGDACWTASDMATLDGIEVKENSDVHINAQAHNITNNLIVEQNSTACVNATHDLVITTTVGGTGVGALIGGPVGAALGGAIGLLVGEVEAAFVAC